MKCIVSEDISREAYAKISKLAEEIILIKKFNPLYTAIRSHADIQCFPLEDNCIVVHPQIHEETIKLFRKYHIDIVFGEKRLGKEYPDNVAYNAAKVGDMILHNFSFSDHKLKNEFSRREYKLIQIKQGYAKCSVLAVDCRSLITSDQGIAKKALEWDIDTLLISPGSIELPGLNYGFIGGASGVLKEKGVVVFNGDITLHPDYNKIVDFLRTRGMEYISLSQGKLIDIGSIFFTS